MGSALQQDIVAIPEATEAELKEAVDYAAKYYLGISAEEFLRRWHAHEISREDPQVQNVLYVINFIGVAKGEAKP